MANGTVHDKGLRNCISSKGNFHLLILSPMIKWSVIEFRIPGNVPRNVLRNKSASTDY